MSIITIQYGQCGNQIGEHLYTTLWEDIEAFNAPKSIYNVKSLSQWFNINKQGKPEPKSILVDTETKVTDSLKFKFKNIIAKSFGGAANNWAFGYSTRSKMIVNEVLDTVRTEVERSDNLSCLLNLFSSSGGTGSGVGSFIIEQLRDEFPNKTIINAAVLPYSKGEVVTQSYNNVLALSHLYSLADSTILFLNEKLHHICTNSLNIKDVGFTNLNEIISQQLAGIFQPVNSSLTADIVQSLTAHPSYKFLQVKSAPMYNKASVRFESSQTITSLIQSVNQQNRFDSTMQSQLKTKLKLKTVSSALIVRGVNDCTPSELKSLTDKNLYVSWLNPESYFSCHTQSRSFNSIDKFAALISNSNSAYLPLNQIVEDAWQLFTNGAYLHHYKKYDVDEDCFLNAFQIMENILEDYKNLS